ncbi:MAG: hypothetical protein ACXW5W_03685 [Candidatus Binatia bacterium]
MLILHAFALALSFETISALFGNQPLIDQDWGLHFHHLKSLEAFWRDSAGLSGYNPYFMAGYPSNTIQDLSVKFFEFAALGLSTIALAPIQWFKITAFLAMASVPGLMFYAGRNFFHNHESRDLIALGAALLATLYWWNSLPREMFFYGMIGFPVAAVLSVWGVSLFYRLVMESPKPGLLHVGWLLFAAVILSLHVQSLVIFMPPMIALLIVQARRIGGTVFFWLVAALAICALVNFTWLITALNHRQDDVSSAIVAQLPLFASSDPLTFLIDYFGAKGYWTFRPSFVEKGFRLMLLILGVLGTIDLIKKGNRPVGIALTGGLSVLFLLTYFGAFIPGLAAWQPLRFKVPFDLFLVIGSAYCFNQWLFGHKTWRFHLVPAMIALGGSAFAINLVQTESLGKLQLRTRMLPEITAIVDWVGRETPREARVLFEESGDETGFVYDGIYLSSFLPHLTGRQLIGGPINLYNDRHHFAEFHSGKLFKRDIGAIADGELRNYFRLYNIGAVVAFHPASVEKLLSIPGLVTVDRRIGPIHLVKVNQPLSWFVEGDGKVQAGANRLELRDLKGGEIVLKYHWVAGLNSEPAANIEAVKLADDPIPFIKLIDPPSSLVLRVQ